MTAACSCGDCATLDLAFPGEGVQLALIGDDWLRETHASIAAERAKLNLPPPKSVPHLQPKEARHAPLPAA